MATKIHVYTGPMGSGKTQTMVRDLYKLATVGKLHTLYINSAKDERSAVSSTHDISGHSDREKLIDCDAIDKLSVDCLSKVGERALKYKVVGIDEAQFFTDIELVEKWRAAGVDIYIAGLYRDKHNKTFGKMDWVINNCDTIQFLEAMCVECIKYGRGIIAAPFTVGAAPGMDDIVVGGMDMYIPVCREHYMLYRGIEERTKITITSSLSSTNRG